MTRVGRWALAGVTLALLAGCASGAPDGAPDAAPTPAPTPSVTATAPPSGPGIAPDDGGVYPLLPATHPHVQLRCPLVPAVRYDPVAIPPADVEAIFICTSELWTPAPDGSMQLVQYVDRVADDDIVPLLTAYAVADAEPAEICDLAMRDPLVIWLHVGGNTGENTGGNAGGNTGGQNIVPVYAPNGGCPATSAEASAAYAAVELHRVFVAREKERT